MSSNRIFYVNGVDQFQGTAAQIVAWLRKRYGEAANDWNQKTKVKRDAQLEWLENVFVPNAEFGDRTTLTKVDWIEILCLKVDEKWKPPFSSI